MRSQRAPRLVFGLMRAERTVRRWIDAHASTPSVGAAGAGVLFYLAKRESSSVGDIARALDASPAATTGLLGRLAAADVIAKLPDPLDARSIRISLTDHGRSLLPGARRALYELNDRLCEGFTSAELEVVDRWLSHSTTVLSAQSGHESSPGAEERRLREA